MTGSRDSRFTPTVMPGLVPGTHDFRAVCKAWIAGTSPAMTIETMQHYEQCSRMCIGVLSILQGLATPAIAFAGLWIAWQQKRLADSRFRNELFDRRMKIFGGVASFIEDSRANPPVLPDKIREFDRAVLEAPFLDFDPSVLPYVREIRATVLRLNQLHQTINGTPQEGRSHERFQHARTEEEKLQRWLGKQREAAAEVFRQSIEIGPRRFFWRRGRAV